MRAFTLIVLSFALLAVGVSALWRNPAEVVEPNQHPTLQVPADSLDFGTVWETESLDLTLPVSNTGPMPVDVVGWSTSCGCVGVSPERISLQPGETKPVVVRLNLLANRRGDDAVRPIEQVVTAKLSGNLEQKWVVKGNAKSFIRPLPDAAPAPQSELASSFEPFLIPLDFRNPVRSVTVTCDNPQVSVRVLARQGSEGYVVEAKLKEGLPVGNYPFGVEITATSSTGQAFPTIRYRTQFAIAPDVRFSPSTVTLQVDRAPTDEVIQVYSMTGQPIRIISVTIPENSTGLVVEAKDLNSFVIRQSKSTRWTQTALVAVVAQVGNKQYQIPYQLAIFDPRKESRK